MSKLVVAVGTRSHLPEGCAGRLHGRPRAVVVGRAPRSGARRWRCCALGLLPPSRRCGPTGRPLASSGPGQQRTHEHTDVENMLGRKRKQYGQDSFLYVNTKPSSIHRGLFLC